MQHLFTVWQSLATEARATAHILLVSDYDGTLTPIVSRPEEAVLSPEVKEKLLALAAHPAFSVGIISGRSLEEIEAAAGITGIYYAGNHGLEIEGPGLSFTNPKALEAQAAIKRLAGQLSGALSHVPGIIVEDKGLSLSVHYRLVKETEVKTALEVFRQVTSPLVKLGKIKVTEGKKVWEVRPPLDWHKGKAVGVIIKEIKARLKLDSLLVIYLGDDTTDEDAFRIMPRFSGWGIFVGGENGSSSAGYFLNSTLEVRDFLSRLLTIK